MPGGDFSGGICLFPNADLISGIFRKVVGSPLWLAQSRLGITLLTSKLPTLLIADGADIDLLKLFIKTTQQAYKILDTIRWDVRFFAIGESSDQIRHGLLAAKLISFTDAGYGALQGSASIEACFAGW